MTNKELITGYRDIVFDIHGMQQRIAWNRRHRLPVRDLPDKVAQLRQELIRFENIVDSIPDRRARNIVLLRFVLGLGERDTADYMGISRGTVTRLCNDTLRKVNSPGIPPYYGQ